MIAYIIAKGSKKYDFVANLTHKTHGTASSFTLSNQSKNQFENIKDANEVGNQIEDVSDLKSGCRFEINTKLTTKIFKYSDIRASGYCKLPNPFSNSITIVNIQTEKKLKFIVVYFRSQNKLNNHRENVSLYEKKFHRNFSRWHSISYKKRSTQILTIKKSN